MEISDKTEFAYTAILKDIIRNVYDQSSILTEKNLLNKYQVSRSPVREALLMLCNEEILQSVPRVGYRIKPISLKNIKDAISLRLIIEQAAMEAYSPKLTDKNIEVLEDLYQKGIDIEKEQDAYIHWQLNKEFHVTLTAMSGNTYYTKTLEKIMKQCFRGASQYYGESWENNLHREDMRWHRKLIDALKNKDNVQANKILCEDINDYLSSFNNFSQY